MIRMSTRALAKFSSSRVRPRSCKAPRRNYHAPVVRGHDEEATEVSKDLEKFPAGTRRSLEVATRPRRPTSLRPASGGAAAQGAADAFAPSLDQPTLR